MNIIETIKAEIERLKKEHQEPTFRGDEYEEGGVNGYQLALDKVLAKLDTLKEQSGFPNWYPNPLEEQPVEIDIRKELASIEFMGVNDARDTETIARHFANIGYIKGREDAHKPAREVGLPKRFDKQALCEQKPAEHLSVRDDFDLEGNLKRKSAGWSDEDEGMLGSIIRLGALDNAQSYWLKRICSILRQQKPAEWSEEDETTIQAVIELLKTYFKEDDLIGLSNLKTAISPNDLVKRLKSLRPHWKPSKEQMEELNKARRFIPYNCDTIESLYNDLLKR